MSNEKLYNWNLNIQNLMRLIFAIEYKEACSIGKAGSFWLLSKRKIIELRFFWYKKKKKKKKKKWKEKEKKKKREYWC